ncbi:MAG TPA: hypothetical protein VGB78_01820 [Thermoplasmata archaeon]|jgi:hypothetical protein
MVSMASLHSLTSELHAGVLTIAFICIVIVALSQFTVRYKSMMPKRLVNAAVRVRGYAEATSYLTAVAGVVFLLLSAWTGMYAWPQEALLDSPTIKNKITMTVFATVLWIGIVFIRTRFGRALWTCPAMAVLYTLLAFAAMGVLGATGSLGAHLTVGESVLDPLWDLFGIDIGHTYAFEATVAAGIALASIAVFLLSLLIARKYDLFAIRLAPETCQKFIRWDEPKIAEPTAIQK